MRPGRARTRRRVLGLGGLAIVAIAVAAVAGALLGGGSSSPAHRRPRAAVTIAGAAAAAGTGAGAGAGASVAASLPAPSPGFAVPRARQLRQTGDLVRWAPVLRAVWARQRPGLGAPPLMRVLTRSPEGTSNLLEYDGAAESEGAEWVRVRLAMLPNGTTGWIPRSALGGWTFVDTRLIIDRRTLRLTLLRAGRPIFSAPVGVGKPSTPTPAGDFYVRDRLTRYASPEYGPVAFGTSARSAVETDWPAGGFIGIHGTDAPQRIPGRISHGCVRLRNAAIVTLSRLMPVGTPVTIR